LQNDFESLRPIPVEATRKLIDDGKDFVRLETARPRARINRRVQWEASGEVLGEPYEVRDWTVAYWPAVALMNQWAALLDGCQNEKHVWGRAIQSKVSSARFSKDVFRYIGHTTTPNGRFGGKKRKRRENYLTKWSMTDEERAALLAAIPPTGRVLEVGTWCGGTIRYLAENRTGVKFLSIDPLICAEGDKALMAWGAGKLQNTTLLLGTIAHYAGIHDHPQFDVIVIDGDHRKKPCFSDLWHCHQWLAPGGQLVVHDYQASRRCNRGVTQAVDYFCQRYGWKVTRQVDKLAWLEKVAP